MLTHAAPLAVSVAALTAAADTCGHPFCDQMVLEAAGGIYWAEDVVLVSKPASPLIDDSCDSDKRSAKSPAAKRSSKKFIAKSRKSADGAKAQVAAANSGHSEPSMYSGNAWIYFGPMSVNSRVHDVKITQGGCPGPALRTPRRAGRRLQPCQGMSHSVNVSSASVIVAAAPPPSRARQYVHLAGM